jgi:preprotein translocase subunit SecD
MLSLSKNLVYFSLLMLVTIGCSKKEEEVVTTEEIMPAVTDVRTDAKLHFRLQTSDFNEPNPVFSEEALLVVDRLQSVQVETTDHSKQDPKIKAQLEEWAKSTGTSVVPNGLEGVTAQVTVTLYDEDALKFEKITEQHIGKNLGVFLDDQLIVTPSIQTKIEGGSFSISLGSIQRDPEAARLIAQKLAAIRK